MRSIQRRFKMMQKKYPETADYIHLARAIKHQKFSKKAISRALNKLVNKDHYSKGDKKHIISLLKKLSDMPEEGQNQTKFALHCTFTITPEVSVEQL